MYGLVLAGGGAKGAFHLGCYKALRELEIEIDGIAGTSIGALNGAMIAQGDFEKAYQLWYSMQPSKLLDINDQYYQQLKNFKINRNNIIYLLQKTREVMNNRGLDISKIKKLLEEIIREEKLRSSELELGIVTISLSDMKPMELFLEDIPRGKVVEYLLASASLPAFKLEKLDGKFFLDGGFYDNLPFKLLSQRGYKKIIAVRTYALGRIREIEKEGVEIIYINPSQHLGRALNFDRNQARKNLKLGYYDTLRVFEDLKGKKYYIESQQDEKYFIEFFLGLGRENIEEIASLLGINDLPYQRALLEKIIPRLAEMLDMKKNSNYEDIALALCEGMAEKLMINEFKIYTFREFLDTILDNYEPVYSRELDHLPDFIKSNEILSKTVKSRLLLQINYLIFNKLHKSR